MQSIGTSQLNRRALLRRGAALAGATAGASLLAFPSLASAGYDEDLSEVRLVCATKRLTINWYTRWIDSGLATSADQTLIRTLRRQEQQHYALLAPLLGSTAPAEADFTFVYPPGALKSTNNARTLGVSLERLAMGIELGSASRIGDAGVAGPVAAIAAANAMHIAVLTGSVASTLPNALSAADASTQLAGYLQ